MSKTYKKVVKKAYSNIAFVKYWGKELRQIPLNPSVSMPIEQCFSEITCEYAIGDKLEIESFIFEGAENQKFKKRFLSYLESIEDVFPLANKLQLKINSINNFPHSAGIASSAAAFAAFSKCLCHIEAEVTDIPVRPQRESFLARLGSGSACRSITETSFNLWGETQFGLGHNEYGIDLDPKVFAFDEQLKDTILVVSSEKKAISSSEGHMLMNGHPFREARIMQAHENIRSLLNAIENNDFAHFGDIIENEALTLHALMMSSNPSYTLLHPNTLKVIELLKKERKEYGIRCYFTLDAGPNLHLIYPESEKEQVSSFIKNKCSDLCESILWANHE